MTSRLAQMWINGQSQDAASGRVFDCINPATEEVVARVAEGDAPDIERAVTAARQAFDTRWSCLDPSEKARCLYRLAGIVSDRQEQLARLVTMECGKPLVESREEVAGCVSLLESFAGLPDKIRGATLAGPPGLVGFTVRQPYGVVGAIIPWNYPLSAAVTKLAPVLASGNCLVLKPAEEAPLTALELGAMCQQAGIPDGVVNIVTGYGPTAGDALVRHRGVDKITFTGSTQVGREILMAAAQSNLKPVTLELGGKAPNIVFADADLEAALNAALFSVFRNQGQTCSAGTRLLVQDSIAAEFTKSLVAKVKRLKVGDPMDPSTKLGALVSEQQFQRVREYIRTGSAEGARLLTGGDHPALPAGYFLEPAVFSEVTMQMRIAREEIFGPVLSILTFRDEDDAAAIGNDVTYGLSAAIWTRDLGRAHRMVARLQAGIIWVNAMYVLFPNSPYGGWKQSGVGREWGLEVADDLMRSKVVWMDLQPNPNPWPEPRA